VGVASAYRLLVRIMQLLVSRRRSASELAVENLVLRHQLALAERRLGTRRVRYEPSDRALLAALSRLLPRRRWSAFRVTPSTLLRWHRELVRGRWRTPVEVSVVPHSAPRPRS
jgi:hypothetical protein